MLARVSSHDIDNANSGFFNITIPIVEQIGKPNRFGLRKIVCLTRIDRKIVKLPCSRTVRGRNEQCLPIATTYGTTPEQFPTRRNRLCVNDLGFAAGSPKRNSNPQ